MSRLFERLPPRSEGAWHGRSPQAHATGAFCTTESENRTITQGFSETAYPNGYCDQ